MTPGIEFLNNKILIGKHLRMSMADNKTGEIWKSFMTDRSMIKNRINEEYISMQVYDSVPDFTNYDPTMEFVKLAVAKP